MTLAAPAPHRARCQSPGLRRPASANGHSKRFSRITRTSAPCLWDGLEFGASYVTKEFNWGKLEFDANAAYIYNYALKQLEAEPNGSAQFLLTDLTDTQGQFNAPPGSGPDFKFVASMFYSKHVFGNDLFRTGFTLNYDDWSELDTDK